MAGVAFRVDVSIEIGTGHVVRCLTLADALFARDFDVTFIMRGGMKALEDLVCARGFRLEILPTSAATDARAHTTGASHAQWLPVSWREDGRQTREVLSRLGTVDWLVVDHYALDAKWENVQRQVCKHILVIDDLADRRHDCDILVDQNLGVGMERRYDGLVPPTCRRLVGPRYALLRDEFTELRRRLRHRDGMVHRILVFMGGTDATNETGKVLDALNKMPSTMLHIDVVVGAANPHADRIEQRVLGLPGAHLHTQISNMAELMAAADLSVGAGGGATWERCCLSLPTIAFSIANNQTANLQALAQNGSVLYLGAASTVDACDLVAALATAMRSPDLLVAMARRSAAVADGLGCGRVASAVFESGGIVSVRQVVAEDGRLLLAWRNDPAAREHSFTKDEISKDEHEVWFTRALADPDHVMLIGEISGKPIGVVRYVCSGREARVSITIAPERRGSGLGVALLTSGADWLRRKRPSVGTVLAKIAPANKGSQHTFAKAGFSPEKFCYKQIL